MKVRIRTARKKVSDHARVDPNSIQPGHGLPKELADLSPDQIEALIRQLESIDHTDNPVGFIHERLHEFVWSSQAAICNSIVHNRRTAVHTCHDVGKSYIAARIAGWWITTHPPGEAFVVSTAPTGRQVRTILWREINRMHAKGALPGRTNQTEWMIDVAYPNGNTKEEIVAFGMKPDDMSPTAFQGIHAKYVLVIFDEACGIAQLLWDAADSLVANDFSRMLAIGNPDDPETEFKKVCSPGSGWNVIGIGYADTPNFTGEKVPEYLHPLLIGPLWVDEKRRKWGERSPVFISKVLGQFPDVTVDGLIPLRWIREAQHRDIAPDDADSVLGLDVGGGGDASCGAHRRGGHVRIRWQDTNPDTMETCGNLIHHLHITKAKNGRVDVIGIGRGVVDRAIELKEPVHGINVGEAATEEGFINLRAQFWWAVRDQFEQGLIDIDPDDDDLAAELASIQYKRTSTGKIQIESKADAKKRGVASPNRAEALMLCYANVPEEPIVYTWGRS